MSVLLSAFQLVLRRSLANWRLLSCLVIGVLVAVALVSSTPLFSNTLSDLGLARALREKPIELIDVQIYAPNYPVNEEAYRQDWEYIRSQVNGNIGAIVHNEERFLKSQTFFVGWADQPIPTGQQRPTGFFQVFSNLEDHVTLLDGRYPNPFPTDLEPDQYLRAGIEIEGLLGATAAEDFDIWTGDRLVFIYEWGTSPAQVTVRITGIIEPNDPSEEFWFLKTDVFNIPSETTGMGPAVAPVAPVFVPEQTFFQGVKRLLPNMTASYNWYYWVDPQLITADNAAAAKAGVQRMERQILAQMTRSSTLTQLDSVISTFEQKLLYTQIPLFLLIFQIVAIVLYYVVTVANMVIDQQAGEIALLRSRGANTRQIFSIYLMEGLLISIFGGLAGPFLGAVVFALLGMTAPFHPLTGGGLLEVRFTSMVFVLAAVAAFLCLIALMLPAMRAASVGVVTQRQRAARPSRAPFWQRMYLDIVLLAIGIPLYFQLRQRGALITESFFGGKELDILSLVAPILFMVAAAIIFLRLFPLIIALASRLSRYSSNTPVVLSLRYMARNPIHYGRLILLLMMAASVGMFAASFLGTLNRSYDERAKYETGTDLRMAGIYEYRSGKGAITDRYAELPAVDEISVAFRGSGTVGSLFTQIDFGLLAVDPATFRNVAWYRDDFSTTPFPELMDILAKDQPGASGLVLPDGTESLGIWARPIGEHPGLTLIVRIEDGKGQYTDFELGQVPTEDWRYLETSLLRPNLGTQLPPPLTLQSIYARLKSSGFGQRQNPTGVYLDDLQVLGSFSAQPLVIEDFEGGIRWSPVAEESAGGGAAGITPSYDTFRTSGDVVHGGAASGLFKWSTGRSFGYRGIYPNLDTRPLSVIISESLLAATGRSVGDLVTIRLPGQFISVVIEDTVRYFPTLDPDRRGFAL
ncbi:MAG: FtsX-like permease family protein, partial [Dehalococcoidales bacterium]